MKWALSFICVQWHFECNSECILSIQDSFEHTYNSSFVLFVPLSFSRFFLVCVCVSFFLLCVASWTNRYLTRALFVLKLYVHCMSTDLPHGTYSVWHHSYNGNIASLIYAVSDVARCAMWKIIRTLFQTHAHTQTKSYKHTHTSHRLTFIYTCMHAYCTHIHNRTFSFIHSFI